MGWLQALIKLCRMAPSFAMKKQLLAFHMGPAKLVGSNWIYTTTIINHALKSNVHLIYIVQTQYSYIATNWAKTKELHHHMFYWRGQNCAFFAWFKIVQLILTWARRLVYRDYLRVLHIYVLYTIPRMLCGTHPHVKGVIRWKIF